MAYSAFPSSRSNTRSINIPTAQLRQCIEDRLWQRSRTELYALAPLLKSNEPLTSEHLPLACPHRVPTLPPPYAHATNNILPRTRWLARRMGSRRLPIPALPLRRRTTRTSSFHHTEGYTFCRHSRRVSQRLSIPGSSFFCEQCQECRRIEVA